MPTGPDVPGRKPAPWEKDQPSSSPLQAGQPSISPPPAPWEKDTPSAAPAPWERKDSQAAAPTAGYQAPRPAGRIPPRYIIGGVVALLVFVVGPAIFAGLRWFGESAREEQNVQNSQQAESQKPEAIELCNRAMKFIVETAVREKGDKRAAIKAANKSFSSGFYSSPHFHIEQASIISTLNNKNAMNVQIDCRANSNAADPQAHCVFSFNWTSGKHQASWD